MPVINEDERVGRFFVTSNLWDRCGNTYNNLIDEAAPRLAHPELTLVLWDIPAPIGQMRSELIGKER